MREREREKTARTRECGVINNVTKTEEDNVWDKKKNETERRGGGRERELNNKERKRCRE